MEINTNELFDEVISKTNLNENTDNGSIKEEYETPPMLTPDELNLPNDLDNLE